MAYNQNMDDSEKYYKTKKGRLKNHWCHYYYHCL
jgi:hypothetical protein